MYRDHREKLLAKRTPAEHKFEEILKSLGASYKREWRIKTTCGATKYLDFFVGRRLSPKHKASKKAKRKGRPAPLYGIGFEIDGSVHDRQQYYDIKRDSEIMEFNDRVFIVRFTNEEVFEFPEHVAGKVKEALSQMRLLPSAHQPL